jgi:multimeric flavodoxin WrbA
MQMRFLGRGGNAIKAVLLDGSVLDEMGTTREAAATFLRARGYQVEVIRLKEKEIADCTGCFGCWTRTPGQCVIPDDAVRVASEFATSDLVLFLTPVSFGGYSYHLKKALDRSICSLLPFFRKVHGKVHHARRYENAQRIVTIGLLPTRDEEAQKVFAQLVERNSYNMQPMGWASTLVFLDERPEMSAIAVKEALMKAGVV